MSNISKFLNEGYQFKFSIIIPTYNVEKYLDKCLESILNQTYNNYEIILIDDVSSDNTINIVSDYQHKDKRLRVVINSENSGPSYCRQKGINISKGEYIIFVDSDDWYCDNNVLEKIALITEEFNSDCICFRYRTLHNHNISINKKNGPRHGIYSCKDIALIKERSQSPFWHYLWNKAYKASIIKDNNISFNINMRSAEDVRFNQEFLIHAKSYYVLTDYMYLYNCKNETSLTRNTKMNSDLNKIWNDIKSEYLLLKNSYKIIGANDDCFKYLIENTLLKYENLLDYAKKRQISNDFISNIYNDPIYLECYRNVDKKYIILKLKRDFMKLFKKIKVNIKKIIR